MTWKKSRPFLVSFTLTVLVAVGAVPSARGQTVEVTSGGEKVVVDGNVVRIESPEGTTVVDADWRRTGRVTVTTDSEQVLVDLGAVVVDDRILLNLAGDIVFAFDSAEILAEAAANLGKVAEVIRSRSVGQVYVLGHTDSIGDAAYNEALSRRRAAAVMSWLARNEGIPASVMVGVGLGATKPVAHNTNPDGSDSPEGRAKNRRVEIQMATRAGVEIGPDVVVAPGGVRITGSQVTVAGGAVEVESGGVRVGEIEVTSEGVSVGGSTVVSVAGAVAAGEAAAAAGEAAAAAGEAAAAAGEVAAAAGAAAARAGRSVTQVGSESVSTCPRGEECDYGCKLGNCGMVCETGAECDFTCAGGDCSYVCEPGADCDFSCSGGDCEMTCEAGAECDFGCSGGDCRYRCEVGSDCDLSCTGGDCTCDGMGC